MTATNSSTSAETISKRNLKLYISDDMEFKEKSRKHSAILSTAFVQLLTTGIYFVIYKSIEIILPEVIPESDIIIMVLLLLLYVAYLAGIAFLYPKVMGKEEHIFSNEALAALFQIHLLFNAVYFFVLWITKSDDIAGTFVVSTLTLYIGFSISLSSVFGAKTKKDFIKCFTQSYCDVGLTKADLLTTAVVDMCVVLVSAILCDHTCVLLAIGGAIIAFHFAYDKVRRVCQKKFSAFVSDKLSGIGNFLIWKSGRGVSILDSLKQALDISDNQIDTNGLPEQTCLYDYIVIINDYPNNGDYPRHVAEIKQLLKADGIIIDPAIFKNHRGRLIFNRSFSWLRIPNPAPIEASIAQYESIFSCGGEK